MSRYADRRTSVTQPPSRYVNEQGYNYQHPSQSYRHEYRNSPLSSRQAGYTGYDDYPEDDDSTIVETQAVGTDLSSLKGPTRGRTVSFGANEVEEFNGSEAPEAIQAAPSRQGNRTPLPPSNGALLRAVPFDGPSSRIVVEQGSMGRRSPASRAMPPPPAPAIARIPSRGSFQTSTYQEPSGYFSRGYDSPRYQREVFEADDGENSEDDAFTAVADSTLVDSVAGTGVASDLSFDYEPNPRRASAGQDVRPSFPTMRASPAPALHRSGFSQASSVTSASEFDASYFSGPDTRDAPPFSSSRRGGEAQLAPPATIQRPRSTGSLRNSAMQIDDNSYPGGIRRGRTPSQGQEQLRSKAPPLLEDSPVEKELINLLKELQFSLALKDFHDTMKIGVERTLVAEDGRGHAYCKIHCKKLPRPEDIKEQRHLRQHWIPLTGSHWEFRTASHSVTVVFKTAALAAYEAQYTTGRR
ncbi:hypothetical protein JCM3765_002723 [Sporobolomyces pararoseus]